MILAWFMETNIFWMIAKDSNFLFFKSASLRSGSLPKIFSVSLSFFYINLTSGDIMFFLHRWIQINLWYEVKTFYLFC